MLKVTRPRLTDDATFTRHLQGNIQYVSAKEPVSWLKIAKVGLCLAALAAGTFYLTPAHSAEVKIIHVTRQNQTVRRVQINKHPSLTVRQVEINKHPSIYVAPTKIKTRTPADNQNSVRIIGE